MAEFAKIVDGKVETVIVIEPEVLATGRWGDPKEWVLNDAVKRKNPAGKGYAFDAKRDAFIPPRPKDAIRLDEETCRWITPERAEESVLAMNGNDRNG